MPLFFEPRTITPETHKADLEEYLRKWHAQKFTHYRYDLEASCFCAFLGLMPFTVEVNNKKAIYVVDHIGNTLTLNDNPHATPDILDYYAPFTSVEKIFAYAQDTVSAGKEFYGTYDAKLGYPIGMCFNVCGQHDPPIHDGTLAITISNFKPLP
jgi:hypothetical protein